MSQDINRLMCPGGFLYFHKLLIIYYCHDKGQPYGHGNFHRRNLDLACKNVQSCFVCDFIKSGKRHKDSAVGSDVEACCTKLHHKHANIKSATLPAL